MTDDAPLRRCFVLIQLKNDQGRMLKDVPVVLKLLERWSGGSKPEPVFRTPDGSYMGYFIKTRVALSTIRTEYEHSSHTIPGDAFMIMELKGELTALGFQKSLDWLKRA